MISERQKTNSAETDMSHLALVLRRAAEKFGHKTAMRFKTPQGWMSLSFRDVYGNARSVSKALLALKVQPGEMVGIFSPNRPEWAIADYGILGIRGVSVPIYATSSARQAEYIIRDAGIRIIFVGGREQYSRILELSGSSGIEKIIVFDENPVLENTGSVYFSDLIEAGKKSGRDRELDERFSSASMEDLSTLIYTSGTTGEPKGVMLDHSCFHYSFLAHEKRLAVSEKDVSMCFLPLAHVFERGWSYFALGHGMEIVYCDQAARIVEYLQEVRPTIMCAVPRFYEKIYSAVFEKLKSASERKKKIFKWSIKVGEEVSEKRKDKKTLSPGLKLRHAVADRLVLKKIRQIVGGRIRFFPCAGAPLAKKIEEFFHAAGIFITYGYGLTETTATVTCHENFYFRPGTVGKPIDGVEVRISENGEVLVKGPTVMKGYYNKPQETAAVFADGWFRTGDSGVLEDGYLTITDRIKDLMKTSGGKYIAPQFIETTISRDFYIDQAVVVGDGRKFVSALIVPAFANLEEYARDHHIPFESIEDLVTRGEIIEFYRKRIDDLSKDLADHEKVKRFILLPWAFSQEAGEITPTMKVKRKEIYEKYKETIERMYV